MPTYYLEVEKIASQCRFLLKWGKNQRLPVVMLAYPDSLANSYSEWQTTYLNYYRHVPIENSLRGRVQGSGSFSLSNVDWYEKLREAEEKLIRELNFWLRSPELYELWEEVKRSSRLVSTQSKASDLENIHIDLLITCSEDLLCLPWEAWKLQDEFVPLDTVRIATKEINAGNQVGLITFSDRVKNVVNLSPFDALQHKRLLAAIDALEADGNTALYDGAIAGLAPLMERRKADPTGVFRLLLLTDGEVTTGLKFEEVKDLMKFSDVRIYPIAYGEVNQQELKAIAALRESTVQVGTPQNVQNLLKEIFQTNL